MRKYRYQIKNIQLMDKPASITVYIFIMKDESGKYSIVNYNDWEF